MKRLNAGIVSGLVIASLAIPLIVHLRSRTQLRDQAAMVAQRAARLNELMAENGRLVNLAQETKQRALSDEEFKELLRLRAEVGRLRKIGAELDALRKANQKLASAESTTGPDYWRKDQLAYNGFATAESALKTMFWAMSTGDANYLLASFSPEVKAKFEKNRPNSDWMVEIKQMADLFIRPANGFRVVDQKIRDDGTSVVSLYFAGEGATRKFVMKKFGAEWRVHDILLAGQSEPGQ